MFNMSIISLSHAIQYFSIVWFYNKPNVLSIRLFKFKWNICFLFFWVTHFWHRIILMNQRSRSISGVHKESYECLASNNRIPCSECRQFVRSEGSEFILRSDAKTKGNNICAGNCFYKKHGKNFLPQHFNCCHLHT